ncbi:hypothetical protein NUW54_g8010 [Trametes sanguinea]|uniref:Uncharacterized protein n=1 Tax=Trametes sanguinea TaxID=158606 RepID=A0ACC1PHR0_9APHY|nr:hypothetical protein NUW54_g8010 [Trametes sanguinea]
MRSTKDLCSHHLPSTTYRSFISALGLGLVLAHDPRGTHLSAATSFIRIVPRSRLASCHITVNTSGVPRLTKFYSPIAHSAQTLVEKIFSLVSSRQPGLCNFLDAPELETFLKPKDGDGEKLRVVYRNYATLYFVFVVDHAESELGILDLIQVFVESLDSAFENVCELDLVFHFDEAHHILAEIIQGGLVLETNVNEIDRAGKPPQSFKVLPHHRLTPLLFSAVQEAARARKESYASANPLSLGGGGAVGSRSAGLQSPLGWLAGRLTGVGAR